MPYELMIRSSRVTYDEFNRFCDSLPATTHCVQRGDSHRIVSAGLTKKMQWKLGLMPMDAPTHLQGTP